MVANKLVIFSGQNFENDLKGLIDFYDIKTKRFLPSIILKDHLLDRYNFSSISLGPNQILIFGGLH